MCGRYYRRSDKQRIAEAFMLGKLLDDFVLPDWDYNVAPQTMQPIIRLDRDTDDRELALLRWGLVPFSITSLDELKGKSTINARAENINGGWWREPFKRGRCLVPADGFYEWKVTTVEPEQPHGVMGLFGEMAPPPTKEKAPTKVRKPFAFSMRDDRPFALAGLWDEWKDPATGAGLQTFTVITTDANELMAPVHDRMPVILAQKDWDRWLSREDGDRPPVDLLRPFPAEEMKAHEAHDDVGNVKNNHPELLNSA